MYLEMASLAAAARHMVSLIAVTAPGVDFAQ
jgi:hypothetical protein